MDPDPELRSLFPVLPISFIWFKQNLFIDVLVSSVLVGLCFVLVACLCRGCWDKLKSPLHKVSEAIWSISNQLVHVCYHKAFKTGAYVACLFTTFCSVWMHPVVYSSFLLSACVSSLTFCLLAVPHGCWWSCHSVSVLQNLQPCQNQSDHTPPLWMLQILAAELSAALELM